MVDNPGSRFPYSFMRYLVSSIALLIVACKIPVFCCLRSCFLLRTFRGHAVGILATPLQAAALAGPNVTAAYSPPVTGFRVRYTARFLLKTDVEISTGLCRAALIIIVDIVLCSTCCTIVDNNVLNSLRCVGLCCVFRSSGSGYFGCSLLPLLPGQPSSSIFVDNTQDFAHILCICYIRLPL